MTSSRMSDGEIVQRMDAIHQELRSGFIDIRNDIMGLTQQVRTTNGRVQEIELWKAEVKGFLLALTIFAAVPTVALAWIALTRVFG